MTAAPATGTAERTAQVVEWTVQWLDAVARIRATAATPLAGEVDSLTLAELLTAAEARWDVSVDDGFALHVLADVRALAAHIAGSRTPSRRTWYAAPDVPEPVSSPPAGVVTARTAGQGTVLGLSRDGDRAAQDGGPASVLRFGEEAAVLEKWTARLRDAFAGLGAAPVWFPLLTDSPVGAEHPQNVRAGFDTGRLPHAACVQLLQRLPGLPDGIHAGLGYGFRREPGRRWNPRGRLEAYRCYEVVAVGGPDLLGTARDVIRSRIAELLAPLAPGAWKSATDGFTPGVSRKEEWIMNIDGSPIAAASYNEHGTAFTGVPHRASFCFGVGLDRLASLGVLR